MKATLWLRFSSWSLPGRTAVILAGFLLWASPAWAAVGFAAAANSSGGAVSSLQYALTVPAGSDRFLIVSVQLGSDCTTAAVPTTSNVTYAGVALTQITSIVGTPCGAGANNTRSEQWQLVAPATGTNNVVVTLSAATTFTIHSGAMAFTGVDQTVPVRASATASGSGNSSTVTVTSAVGDMVANTVGQGTSISTPPGGGATQRFLNNVSSSNTLNNSAGSTAPGAAGSVTMTWTFGAIDEWQTISSSLAASVATASQRVQTIVCKSTGTATPPACNWSAATNTGNLLLMAVATAGDTSAPTITVAAPWVNVDATKYPYYPGTAAPQVGMWYIANASSRSSETVTLSAAKDIMITLIEVAGMATSGVVDQTARNGSTTAGTPIDSGTTATTTQASEYWLAVGANRNTTTPGAATGGFTNITPTTGTNPSFTANATTSSAIGFAVADQTVSATGTAHATWSLGTTRPRTGIVATFKGCAKPSDAGYVAVAAQSGQATVYWSSADPVTILWRSVTAFSNEAPADGWGYVAGQTGGTLGTARVAYDSASATVDTNVSCTGSSCTHTGLANGTTYYYKVLARAGSGGGSCYAPGTVNTAGGVSATPNTGTNKPDWTYMLAGGSILNGGIASWNNTLYTSSNAKYLISLNTTGSPKGGQSWTPQATTAAIQGWLTWLPGSGGIKSVQTGTWTITAPPESVAITTVDPSRAFVVCIQQDGQSDAGRRVTCELSASSITFTAGEAGTVLQWYVAEFKGGVSVQRGTATFATTDATLNVPISQVDLKKSFVLISEWTSDALTQNADEEWTMRAQLTSPTNLELSRNWNAANQPVTVAWQVVQMAAATVRRGTTCIGASCPGSDGATTTVTLTPAVTPGQSFLVFSRRGPVSGGLEGEYQVMGQITGGGASLTFTRAINTTNIVDIAWEIVSLSDGTRVLRNTSPELESYLTDAAVNVTLSPAVDRLRSIPLISVSGVLNGSATGDPADLDSTTFTAMFTDSDLATPCSGATCPNLQMVRASNPNADASIYWQVVEFGSKGGPMVVIGGEQGSGSPLSGRVISVDPFFGITNWERNLRADTGVDADAFQASVASQMRAYSPNPVGDDDLIFVATRNSSVSPVCGNFNTNNKVFALKASDGSVLWNSNPGCPTTYNMDYIVGMPAVDYVRNWLYVASYSNGGSQPSLWIFNTLNGSLVKSFSGLGDIKTSPTPSYDGRTLYVANTLGRLYAIDLTPATPALKWASPSYMDLGSTINGFLWEDGALATVLYFSTADGNVWCIRDPGVGAAPPSTPPASPQAACPWKTLVNATGVSNLLPLDGTYVGIYVGGADGTLRKLNPTSGAVDKTFTVDATLRTVGDPSTETGNEVYVSTTEGRIYKILLPLP